MMKYLKIVLALTMLILMISSLIYKNLVAPEEQNSAFAQLSNYLFPTFMLFSMFMLFLKRREEKKDAPKLSDEDRAHFSSIGTSDDYKDL